MKKTMKVLSGVAVVLGVVLAALILAAASTGCSNEFIDVGGECAESADCADGDPCTVDLCDVDHVCRHVPSDSPACDPCVPAIELCNSRDDDCDGETDEDYEVNLGNPCISFSSEGQCEESGVITCNLPGEMYQLACSASPPGVPWGVPMSIEWCGNGFDDDCNGLVDDGCECVPADELCDGADNDCDGETDEDYADSLGDVCVIFRSDGYCSTFGVITCNAPGEMYQLACDSSPPGTAWSTPLSIDMCGNGLDDNCNAVIDEGC